MRFCALRQWYKDSAREGGADLSNILIMQSICIYRLRPRGRGGFKRLERRDTGTTRRLRPRGRGGFKPFYTPLNASEPGLRPRGRGGFKQGDLGLTGVAARLRPRGRGGFKPVYTPLNALGSGLRPRGRGGFKQFISQILNSGFLILLPTSDYPEDFQNSL